MMTIYVAFDGKEFEDECECEDYEWLLKHPNLKEVEFYAKYNQKLEDALCEEIYGDVKKIIIYNKDALKDLYELADYVGYDRYKLIDECGIWVWKKSKFVKKEKIK